MDDGSGCDLRRGCHGAVWMRKYAFRSCDKSGHQYRTFYIGNKAAPEALHTAPVIPSVSGGLISNPPDIGATVKAGDVLFKIDASQYEAQASALQQKIAESSAQAAPVYNSPSVDNSLEASF